eukprot:3931829-Rhodomonas_salina.3
MRVARPEAGQLGVDGVSEPIDVRAKVSGSCTVEDALPGGWQETHSVGVEEFFPGEGVAAGANDGAPGLPDRSEEDSEAGAELPR